MAPQVTGKAGGELERGSRDRGWRSALYGAAGMTESSPGQAEAELWIRGREDAGTLGLQQACAHLTCATAKLF